jgi:hypothetical protein
MVRITVPLLAGLLIALALAPTASAAEPASVEMCGEFAVQAHVAGHSTSCVEVFSYYYCTHMGSGFVILGVIDTGCIRNGPPPL